MQRYWKPNKKVGEIDADIEYAKSKGYLFDPLKTSHDEIVSKFIKLKNMTSAKAVGDAFLVSLSTRRLDLRSALGSFAINSRFPEHKLNLSPYVTCDTGAKYCEICGIYEFIVPTTRNLSRLNFERYKWGGIQHDDPLYAWLDLSQFLKIECPEPTETDRKLMREILHICASLPSDDGPNALAKQLTRTFKSNKDERRVAIEILSYCGVLQPSNHSGYFNEFTIASERVRTSHHKNDWSYPANWWKGSDGINSGAVATYFPNL